jgi:hypothetical protein
MMTPKSWRGIRRCSIFSHWFLHGTLAAETKLKKRAIELNQGRAAQMGILALMVHEQLGVPLIPTL